MPEFRIRRKKRDKRRHTLHDSTEAARQIQQASQLYQEHNEIIFGPNEVSVDEAVERSLRLQRSFDDGDQFVSSTSSSEPVVKATIIRKISSKFSECLYLRHGADMRRCPMPSPITLSTVRQLFINLFDLSPSVLKSPNWHLFLLDRSNTWKSLESVSLIHDHCTILLVDSSDVGTLIPSPTPVEDTQHSRCSTGTPDIFTTPDSNELSSHRLDRISPEPIPRPKSLDISILPSVVGEDYIIHPTHSSPFSVQSSSSGIVVSDSLHHHNLTFPSSSSIIPNLMSFHQSVQCLKLDLAVMRTEHHTKMSEIQFQLALAKQTLQTALKGVKSVGSASFRQERLALDDMKEKYMKLKNSSSTFHDFSILQTIVEGLRVDAVNRRCRVDSEEVETLRTNVQNVSANLSKLQDLYIPMEARLKDVMKQELQVIVTDESFVEQEAEKLTEAVDTCAGLSQTLETLQQLAVLQRQRSPHIPIFEAVPEPDRQAVLDSIISISPNHKERVQSLQMAESVQQKRKHELSPSMRALRKFESSLIEQQNKLRPTGRMDMIENQRDWKVKSFYMEEKVQRQKEIEEELKLAEEVKAKKREKEIEEVKEKLKFQEEKLKLEEAKKQEELKEEKRKLEEERKKQEEERIKLQEQRKKQEEEQKRLEEEIKKQEEERKKIEEMKKREERNRIEQERRKQLEEKLKFEIKKEERRKLEEQEAWKNYVSSDDSPESKAKKQEILWRQIQQQAQIELEDEEKKKADRERKRQQISQQIIMDSLHGLHTPGGTPIVRRRESPRTIRNRNTIGNFNELESIQQFPSPTLPHSSGSNSNRDLNSIDSSLYSQKSLHDNRLRLGPSLSTELRKTENSYDTLQKLFSSDESIDTKQNQYDTPWNSKKLPLTTQRHGSLGTNDFKHKRNKSDVQESFNEHDFQHPHINAREHTTSSPGNHLQTSRSPSLSITPPLKVPEKVSKQKTTQLPVQQHQSKPYEEITIPVGPISRRYSPSTAHVVKENGHLPPYSQPLVSNVHNSPSFHSSAGSSRQRSNTTNSRITQYPINKLPDKPRHTVSYV